MKKYIYPIIILLLLIILSIQYCSKPIKQIDKPDTTIIEQTVYNYKDSIIIRDSLILTYVSIKDSISKSNKNSLEIHYDKQMDTLNTNEIDYRDTLIDDLKFEIEISDTIINNLNETIIYRDTVIHNLEIINETNKLYIEDIESELVKSQKKIKRKNILLIISTSIATVLALIVIAN